MDDFEALFRRFGREFPAGEAVFQFGDVAEQVYVVNTGTVREGRVVLGVDKPLRELGPGDLFGEVALVTGRHRNSYARCLSACRLLVIPAETFEAMVSSSLEIAARLLHRMAERIDGLEREVGHLLYRSADARVVSLLAQPSEQGREVELTRVAGVLALRPGELEEVTRRLVDAGLVTLAAGHLRVSDPAALEEYASFLRLRERFGTV